MTVKIACTMRSLQRFGDFPSVYKKYNKMRWRTRTSVLGRCLLVTTTMMALLHATTPSQGAKNQESRKYENGTIFGDISLSKQLISDLKHEKSFAPRNHTENLRKYTPWTKWSDCNENSCTQTRRRVCRVKRKCGTTIQTEEKRCRFSKGKGRKRLKCGRKKRKGRKEDKLSPTEISIHNRRKYKFKIIDSENEQLEKKILPSKSSKWYSKWSRWSPCSRQCTTRRKRWCKKPKLCTQDIITETAYCYVEGTYCQRWIQKKIQQNKNNPNGELFVDTVIEETRHRDRNEIDNANSVNIYPSQPQCGISNHRNMTYKKSAWSLTRIIGGREAPRGKWPWHVAILNRFKEAFCGGTLVAPRWVLTAAHCIRRRLFVRLGEHSLSNKDGLEVRVIQKIVHPGYDPDTVDNDVALLRLPPLSKYFQQLPVVCLPKSKQSLPFNKLCTIIGWGKRKITDVAGSDTLHEAQVPIVSTDTCKNTYIDYYITSNMFCAGYKKGRMDTCAGDSGGPLLCRDSNSSYQPWTIYGITSFGDGCGKKGKFGIYTRVPNYVRWIHKVLRISDYNNS